VHLVGFIIRIYGNVYYLTAAFSLNRLLFVGLFLTRVETRISWVWCHNMALQNS